MSANMNLLILAGNLTRAPELRYTPGGSPVCAFSVAVNRKWKDAQGRMNDEVTFIECECWGLVAENVAQYLGKGSSVIVRGRIKQDRWQDKSTGAQRSKLKCVAEHVQFLSSPRKARTDSAPAPAAGPDNEPAYDELPADAMVDDQAPF